MAQNDIEITTTPPLPGLTLVNNINSALQSVATDFSGAVDPAGLDGVGPYVTWADTANGLLKRRNAADTAWDITGALSLNAGSDHAGSEPASPFPYMTWSDTANMLLKRRNAANTAWVVLGPLLDFYFARSNILGTVSQSGGVPTGALLQRTTTAVGTRLRYACGAEIQYGAEYVSATVSSPDGAQYIGSITGISFVSTWVIAPTSVIPSASHRSVCFATSVASIGLASFGALLSTGQAYSPVSVVVYWTAFGRWYA